MIDSPRIAIVGTGALGGFFGAHLAHAGNRVCFLVRSGAEDLRRFGWRVDHTDAESFVVEAPEVFSSTSAIGPVDLIVVALKSTQNAALETLLPPLIQPGTVLLTVQNGLGNVEVLADLFPEHPVLAGLCQIGVNRVRAGHLQSYVPGGGFVQVGPGPQADASYVSWIAQLLTDARIRTRELASLDEALWRKLMWNVPYNGLTVASGCVTTDVIVERPALRAVTRGLMEELRAAAAALGSPIEATYTDKLIDFTAKLGPYRPSSLIDWEAGRPLEVDAIWGEPLRRGQSAGVSMPHLATLNAILEEMDRQRAAEIAKKAD